MLVDLPDGWDIETDPFMLGLRNLVLGARPTERYSRGIYITHLNFSYDIKHLIKTEYPFSDEMSRFFRELTTEEVFALSDDDREMRRARIIAMGQGPVDFGVCDSPEQILLKWPELESDERKFLIYLTRIDKDPENKWKGGGWRWHKWGEYIGVHEPECEYLDDEEDPITHVYVFHIVEMKE